MKNNKNKKVKKVITDIKKIEVEKEPEIVKINIGYGDYPEYQKKDFCLTDFPWPLKDESVNEVMFMMRLNYVPGKLRGLVMDELYRILVPEGKVIIATPYWSSVRSTQDYAAEWPPVSEQSYCYFNRPWREVNHPDRTLKCNFDFVGGYVSDAEITNRNDESRNFYIKHYVNSVNDVQGVLTKKP